MKALQKRENKRMGVLLFKEKRKKKEERNKEKKKRAENHRQRLVEKLNV